MNQTRLLSRRGHDLVWLHAEAEGGREGAEATRGLLARFAEELATFGLSLDDAVRTRLWARDRASRDSGSAERRRILSGPARAASSSYIAPDHFASGASVALELLAVHAGQRTAKVCCEYDPPRVPVRYVIYDRLAFLSGVTAVLPGLAAQVEAIIHSISESLQLAGTGWDRVAEAGFFLHRSESLEALRDCLRSSIPAAIPVQEYGQVDGYSSEGKLIEIEVTALV